MTEATLGADLIERKKIKIKKMHIATIVILAPGYFVCAN